MDGNVQFKVQLGHCATFPVQIHSFICSNILEAYYSLDACGCATNIQLYWRGHDHCHLAGWGLNSGWSIGCNFTDTIKFSEPQGPYLLNGNIV